MPLSRVERGLLAVFLQIWGNSIEFNLTITSRTIHSREQLEVENFVVIEGEICENNQQVKVKSSGTMISLVLESSPLSCVEFLCCSCL